MYNTKLCLGLSNSFELAPEEQIKLLHKIGFEGFFSAYSPDIEKYSVLARELGMDYQSVHAPFTGVHHLWESDESTNKVLNELIDCARACSDNGVGIMVCHAIIGFDRHTPSDEGVQRFGTLVDEAKKLGVKIAFENTEGIEYLHTLMEAFKNESNVGFCLDTGHEVCYSKGEDLLKVYGDRLIATHINDNLGVKDFGGKITFLDDLHLLPYDGIVSFTDFASRMAKLSFDGPLTFELLRGNRPGRLDGSKYLKLSPEEYLTEAYARACRVAEELRRAKA